MEKQIDYKGYIITVEWPVALEVLSPRGRIARTYTGARVVMRHEGEPIAYAELPVTSAKDEALCVRVATFVAECIATADAVTLRTDYTEAAQWKAIEDAVDAVPRNFTITETTVTPEESSETITMKAAGDAQWQVLQAQKEAEAAAEVAELHEQKAHMQTSLTKALAYKQELHGELANAACAVCLPVGGRGRETWLMAVEKLKCEARDEATREMKSRLAAVLDAGAKAPQRNGP